MEKKEKKESIRNVKKRLEECQRAKSEYLAGWQRERADFLNYKKEEIERMEALIRSADRALILRFLAVLDNLDLAEKKIPKDLEENENVKGLLQIKNQIKAILEKEGVKEIESLGKKFDPHFQEITEEIEKDNIEPGIVVEEIQKGYRMGDKLLRPAKVKIAKKGQKNK